MDDRGSEIDKCLEMLQLLEEKQKGVFFADLRDKILEGDWGSWSAFLEKYSRFIYSNALKQCFDFEDKEDLVYEIYCGVVKKLCQDNFRVLRDFEERSDFKTYLFRIIQTVRQRILNLKNRQRKMNQQREDPEAISCGNHIPSGAVQFEEELRNCLAHVSPGEKQLLKLRYREGLTFKELAGRLSLSDGNRAAYEIRRILRKFAPIKKLKARFCWREDEYPYLAGILGELLFE